MTSVFFLELGVLLKEIALKLGKAKKSVLHAALVIPSSTLAPNLAANESGRGAHEDCQESGQDSFCPPPVLAISNSSIFVFKSSAYLVSALFPASLRSPLSLLTGTLLSMGFGFVEYKKPESAQKALRRLQVRLSIVGLDFFPEMVGEGLDEL